MVTPIKAIRTEKGSQSAGIVSSLTQFFVQVTKVMIKGIINGNERTGKSAPLLSAWATIEANKVVVLAIARVPKKRPAIKNPQ